MSLVSIIVPIYNSEKVLCRCIDSILNQTYSNFEVLLINDGSSDNSELICKGYVERDSRVNLFSQRNGGVSSARNTGLKLAKGEWIAFVDSDDWIEPDYLSELIPASHNELSICSFIYEGTRSSNINHLRTGLWDGGNIVRAFSFLLSNMAFCGSWCKIFSKSLIDEYRLLFDTRVSAGEDMLFVYEFIGRRPLTIKTNSRPLYHYVDFVESLSHKIVPVKTSLLVIDLLSEKVREIETTYKCNIREVYNEMLCSQLVNIRSAIGEERGLKRRMKYLNLVLANTNIKSLLNDKEYLLNRRKYSSIQKIQLRVIVALIRVYYAIFI